MTQAMFSPLPRGAMIGILGGGQLGRMLSAAASRLGFQTHIYCPDENSPAKQLCAQSSTGPYEDLDSVKEFSKSCDVVTYEFENIPEATIKAACEGAILHPGARAIETAQDRLVEKTFLRDQAGVNVAPFADINSTHDLITAVADIGLPCVLKTRRFGYDGKGQIILREQADLDTAFEKLGEQPCILEGFVPFKREVSIIAARGANGDFATYPLIENIHKNHILHISTAPAKGASDHTHNKAQNMAHSILEKLDYVGVIGVEFFEMENGDLIVNEIAPRVHNSGHWTQNAGCIDQFELHIRAITGWPLGADTNGRIPLQNGVEMTNLIGDDIENWESYAREPNTFLHLYGKREARNGRKMGHVNRIIPLLPPKAD